MGRTRDAPIALWRLLFLCTLERGALAHFLEEARTFRILLWHLLALRRGLFGDLTAQRHHRRNFRIRERLHVLLALHRFFDERRELFLFLLLALRLSLLELGHYVGCEELERFADMLVLVASALLDERDLVDAHLVELAQVLAQLVGRADAVFAAADRRHRFLGLLERFPDVGSPGRVDAEAVMMSQRIGEEAETITAATARLFLVAVHREARDHRDIGVHRVPDRHALFLEDAVIVVDPVFGFAGIDKGEGERADAEPRRELDRLAVRAGDP